MTCSSGAVKSQTRSLNLVFDPWFGDICGSRKDFCMFYKSSRSLYFKFYSLRLLTSRPMQYRVPAKLHTEMHWQYWPSTLLGGIELLLLICAVRVCRLQSLLSILLIGTLCSKKWYDMPHIRCGINSRQWSTIPRIGRHSAVYN